LLIGFYLARLLIVYKIFYLFVNTPAQLTTTPPAIVSNYNKPAATAPIAQIQQPDTTTSAEKGMKDSYVGIGITPGISNGGGRGETAKFGGNLSGRYAIENTPLSLRGTFLFGNDTTATIPKLTVDVPVAPNTNVFVGGGYSFLGNQGENTPIGNKDAAVVTGGVETALNKNIVAYGSVDWGVNAFESSNASAAAIQLGVGYRLETIQIPIA
jgi:hypothetical protein